MIECSKLIPNVSVLIDSSGITYLFDHTDNDDIYGRVIEIKYIEDEYQYKLGNDLINLNKKHNKESLKEVMRVDIS